MVARTPVRWPQSETLGCLSGHWPLVLCLWSLVCVICLLVSCFLFLFHLSLASLTSGLNVVGCVLARQVFWKWNSKMPLSRLSCCYCHARRHSSIWHSHSPACVSSKNCSDQKECLSVTKWSQSTPHIFTYNDSTINYMMHLFSWGNVIVAFPCGVGL